MKRFSRSLRCAIAGCVHVTRTEPNMRLHLFAAVLAVVAGGVLRIDPIEWALIVGCIGAVISLELVNTAIERMADRVQDSEDPLIRQAKDAAAGAVLIASMFSLLIAAIIFGPKMLGETFSPIPLN